MLARAGPGSAVAFLGLVAGLAPLVYKAPSAGLVGLSLLLGGALDVLHSFRVVGEAASRSSYLSGCVTLVMGILVLSAPILIGSALLVFLAVSFALDGLHGLAHAWEQRQAPGVSSAIALGALGSFALAAFVIMFQGAADLTLGVASCVRLLGRAFSMLTVPTYAIDEASVTVAAELDLPDLVEIQALTQNLARTELSFRQVDRAKILAILGILLAIHLGRMSVELTILGLLGPCLAPMPLK
jgi:uncharacterized membrane protein HdeD (DUF308 family)